MIKSDKWIRSMCQKPDGQIFIGDQRKPVLVYRQKNETLSNATERVIKSLNKQPEECTFISGGDDKPFTPMISPFEPSNIRYKEELISPHLVGTGMMIGTIDGSTGEHSLTKKEKILSYGTSSFGYDVTLSDDFRIFTNINSSIIDPLNFDEKCLVEFKGDVCILPPNSYLLGVTREYFRIPRDVVVICLGKSTYARCGAIVNVTPVEPGFEGHVVIEISNATSLPMKIYANQGIAQFMFFQSDEECETSYADKGGKYQGQTGVTLAKG